MNNVIKKLAAKLVKDTRGATVVEYIVLVSVVALGAIGAGNAFKDKVESAMDSLGGRVEDAAGN